MAVGVGPLSRADVMAVARAGARMELAVEACEAMAASRAHVAALVLVDYLIAAAALVHGLEFATLNIKHFPMFADLEPLFSL